MTPTTHTKSAAGGDSQPLITKINGGKRRSMRKSCKGRGSRKGKSRKMRTSRRGGFHAANQSLFGKK
jgi:hypothetical protein